MNEDLNHIGLEDFRELETWACAWYDCAVAARFVRPPYCPDSVTLEHLRGYFHAGLSPMDAAYACFLNKH
jgi:hypothetical protein